jgi:ubiquitin carboxyl-terminal hydrolase 22/27/51
MDTIVVAPPKAGPLASPKVVKNSKGAIVPSSQMAHVGYGCGALSTQLHTTLPPLTATPEHMRDLLENARKQTLANYKNILQKIHEQPSVITQTHKSAGDGRPVVGLRPLYLCLQCPLVNTEADRDQHIETKLHCFCGLPHSIRQGHMAN